MLGVYVNELQHSKEGGKDEEKRRTLSAGGGGGGEFSNGTLEMWVQKGGSLEATYFLTKKVITAW